MITLSVVSRSGREVVPNGVRVGEDVRHPLAGVACGGASPA